MAWMVNAAAAVDLTHWLHTVPAAHELHTPNESKHSLED